MTKVFTAAEAKNLGLAGRVSRELVSGDRGSESITLRLVEIPIARAGETPRASHLHAHCEECIYVLSGQGTTHADSGEYNIKAGDALLMSAGESHVTRNTGDEPLVLLCFFPVADVSSGTSERLPDSKGD